MSVSSSTSQDSLSSQLRGWVYVIANEAMPDLVKVGYSRKDPVIRARSLDCTGAPKPYFVIYDALVRDPYAIEQRVHRALVDSREGKEWYRAQIAFVIREIRTAAGDGLILEHYHMDIDALVDKPASADNTCRFESCKLRGTAPVDGKLYCLTHFWKLRKDAAVKTVPQNEPELSPDPDLPRSPVAESKQSPDAVLKTCQRCGFHFPWEESRRFCPQCGF